MPRWGHLASTATLGVPWGARLGPPPGRCLSPYQRPPIRRVISALQKAPSVQGAFDSTLTSSRFLRMFLKKCSAESRGVHADSHVDVPGMRALTRGGRRCPSCRSNNPPNRRICSRCGHGIRPFAPPRPVAESNSGATQWLFTAGHGVLPLITLSGTALRVTPMTFDPSASEVLLRMLAEIAFAIAVLSVALHFIFPVVIILIVAVLLGGSPGKLISWSAGRAASAAFWLLGMRGLGVRPPGSTEGLGFRMQVGSDLTFVQLRGGTGRITANDSITVIGRRTVEGVVRAYFVRNHGDGSWIIAKGVLSRCAVAAFLLSIALSRAVR
ncbi:MAG: hypothetical protein QOJ93_2603 [Actinomycetota bacterium]|nr:hypothetical protein [Actinomycetota bacterium]